jgi:hypothetical protein
MNRYVSRTAAASLMNSRTPDEDETFVALKPFLQLLNRYAHARPVRPTMELAYDHRAPVGGRVTPTTPRRNGMAMAPVYVHPQMATEWLEDAQYSLPDGLRYQASWVDLVIALEWMGRAYDAVRPAVTQRIGGEPHTWQRPYARAGWWICSGLVWQRILDGHWVPVREPLPGRPAHKSGLIEQARPIDTPALRALAARDTVKPSSYSGTRGKLRATSRDRQKMCQLLTDFASTEPTCLLARAHGSGHPLVTRSAGRLNASFADIVAGTLSPSTIAARLPLARDSIVVEATTFAAHIRAVQDRVATANGWSPTLAQFWTTPTVALLLDDLTDHFPDQIKRVSRLSTIDTEGRARVGLPGWFRVSLAWLGLPDADAVTLATEWAAWQAEREQAAMHAELVNVGDDGHDLSQVEETRV